MLASLIDDRGGLIATHELHAAGYPRAAIAAALRRREIIRVRQGWYSLPELHPALLQAARVGGRLSCVSLLALRGCWTIRDAGLHVAIETGTCRLRRPQDARSRLAADSPVVTHWSTRAGASRITTDLVDAFRDLFACQPPLVVAAVADSARRLPLVGESDWSAIVAAAPARLEAVLARADGVCESGTETTFWQRCRTWPVRVRRQVAFRGIGRVDFVVGDRLIVEVDGYRWHEDRERFESDRQRDALFSRLGYRVLRFSYEQVMNRWPEVEAAVLAAVVRGDHL